MLREDNDVAGARVNCVFKRLLFPPADVPAYSREARAVIPVSTKMAICDFLGPVTELASRAVCSAITSSSRVVSPAGAKGSDMKAVMFLSSLGALAERPKAECEPRKNEASKYPMDTDRYLAMAAIYRRSRVKLTVLR